MHILIKTGEVFIHLLNVDGTAQIRKIIMRSVSPTEQN